ncbi:MAG: glycosyltransferase family 2 protein [Bacteroidales bacterium]
MVEFSIIIVNYNSGNLLVNCVESIFTHVSGNVEIIVVDNDSRDDSIALINQFGKDKPLKIIRSEINLGFAKANNLGVESASGNYYHFLNPDTLMMEGFEDAYEFIREKKQDAIYVTGLTDGDGHPQKMKHLIPTLGNYFERLFNKNNCKYWNIGASLIIDKDSFIKIGGWPEDYFMYTEDLDFFYRSYKFNIPVKYIKQSVIHIGKGTSEKVWTILDREKRIELSLKTFYKKYGIYYQYPIIRTIQLMYLLIREPGNFGTALKAALRSKTW